MDLPDLPRLPPLPRFPPPPWAKRTPPEIRDAAPDRDEMATERGRITTGITKGGPTDAETLQYQHEHLTEELSLLETHLSEGCQIFGKPCDCCLKAAKRIKAYAMESVPIAARQGVETAVYTNLADWAISLMPKVEKAVVEAGTYAKEYPEQSGQASLFRKELEKGCPSCEPKRVSEFLQEHKGE